MKKGKNKTKKIPKWEMWATEQALEPYWLKRGRQILWGAVAVGVIFLGAAIFIGGSLFERLGLALLGLGLLLWAGNWVVLSYGKIENEDDQFLMKCLVRIGGMLFGPALSVIFFGMDTGAAEIRTWEEICLGAVIISALTVLPFGLSLLKLILLRRKGKATKRKSGKNKKEDPWE